MRIDGLDLIVSPALPIHPTDGEDATRIVRHGMADVLGWLGEAVGPKPGDCIHILRTPGTLPASREMADRIASETQGI